MARQTRHFLTHVDSRIDAYLEGGLSDTARLRIERHVQDCSSCATELEDRKKAVELIKQADSQASHVQVHEPYITTGAAAFTPVEHYGADSGTVLGRRSGVAGWKVVIGLGALCMIFGGLILTAWVIGGQDEEITSEQLPPKLLPRDLQLSPVNSRGTISSTDVPRRAEAVALSANLTLQRENTKPLNVLGRYMQLYDVPTMRSAGWNIPRLGSLGLTLEYATVSNGENWAAVSSMFHGGQDTAGRDAETVVHECRYLTHEDTIDGCPADGLALEKGEKLEVQGEHETYLDSYDNGTWSAVMVTDRALYRVDSTLEDSLAEPLLASLAVSDNARLSESDNRLSESNDALERVQRGLRTMFFGAD